MKSVCVRGVLAALVLGLAAGCATSSSGRKSSSFFHDDPSVSVVLHYYRWDSIYMTRPDTRQDGFLPVLTREQIARELRHRTMRRNTAVVVIGFTQSNAQIAQLAHDWKQLLGEQGFSRVVLLRAGRNKKIDGLPVIEDSAITSGHETEGRVATFAALPPAPGADAPYSSSAPIR
jgi:hypothetical protein